MFDPWPFRIGGDSGCSACDLQVKVALIPAMLAAADQLAALMDQQGHFGMAGQARVDAWRGIRDS